MNVRRKLFNPKVDVAIKLKPQKHEFSKYCIDELEHFAKLHKYDDRKQFKDAWTKWIESNQDMIDNEKQRLADYDGDIIEKMYVSARYYFRKKTTKETKPRRKYVSLDRELLAVMDQHIYALIQNNINQKTHVSDTAPSFAFDKFCENYMHIIDNIECSEDKLKKTFKNRYHMMKRSLASN